MLKIVKNQQGVSILLSILILSSLTVLTLAMAEVVLRVGKSASQIGDSEVAYYATETALEKALYQIERERTIAGLDGLTGNLENLSGATWSLTVEPLDEILVDCDSLNDSGICVGEIDETISSRNPLKAKVAAGKSFQLEMDFAGLASDNLNTLHISWTGGNGKLVAIGEIDQIIDDHSPVSLNQVSTNHYIIKLINQSSSLKTFEIKPTSTPNPEDEYLPVGIKITATGNYKNQKRVMEVERLNWQIY